MMVVDLKAVFFESFDSDWNRFSLEKIYCRNFSLPWCPKNEFTICKPIKMNWLKIFRFKWQDWELLNRCHLIKIYSTKLIDTKKVRFSIVLSLESHIFWQIMNLTLNLKIRNWSDDNNDHHFLFFYSSTQIYFNLQHHLKIVNLNKEIGIEKSKIIKIQIFSKYYNFFRFV